MDIGINEVKDMIESLESNGELSIKEEKYLKVAKLCVQLAEDNVALKAVFSQGEIPSEAVDAFMETAVMDHDWNETSEWSWVENETEVIHAVLDALKPETPATDRILAEAEARGVEKFAAMTEKVGDEEEFYDNRESSETLKYTAKQARLFAQQLREGADK